jgi:hypothetical protein
MTREPSLSKPLVLFLRNELAARKIKAVWTYIASVQEQAISAVREVTVFWVFLSSVAIDDFNSSKRQRLPWPATLHPLSSSKSS